jgi:hypothetical protein
MALVTLEAGTTAMVPVGASTPMDDAMPGLGSFIVFVFLAISLYFLLRNMNARLRRMSYREKERVRAQQEAAGEADAAGADPAHADRADSAGADAAEADRADGAHVDDASPADPTADPGEPPR